MYPSITIEELEQKRQEGIAVIDVREELPFNQNHLPEAINIPLNQLSENINELDDDTTYYVICTLGVRSMQACEFLAHEGYDVVNVEGGMQAYREMKK
ncbi:rhodanese-like domain-containing protein [Enterococcus saccharolyticus]|uniref:rhodanese-like domain-containing protein n=1 Tax=Enterococcus saccharolyticus TaxID=41997 RepID=UPI0039E1274E